GITQSQTLSHSMSLNKLSMCSLHISLIHPSKRKRNSHKSKYANDEKYNQQLYESKAAYSTLPIYHESNPQADLVSAIWVLSCVNVSSHPLIMFLPVAFRV